MRYETVWGTDLEIKVAASYFQLPIYVCTQRSGTLTYYWECFQPVLSNNLQSLAQPYILKHLLSMLLITWSYAIVIDAIMTQW